MCTNTAKPLSCNPDVEMSRAVVRQSFGLSDDPKQGVGVQQVLHSLAPSNSASVISKSPMNSIFTLPSRNPTSRSGATGRLVRDDHRDRLPRLSVQDANPLPTANCGEDLGELSLQLGDGHVDHARILFRNMSSCQEQHDMDTLPMPRILGRDVPRGRHMRANNCQERGTAGDSAFVEQALEVDVRLSARDEGPQSTFPEPHAIVQPMWPWPVSRYRFS